MVLCASLLLVAVDATVLHVAVPAVTEVIKPGAIELLWIVDVYPLVCASLLILFGTLGDRVGRRRVLLLGYALFGVFACIGMLINLIICFAVMSLMQATLTMPGIAGLVLTVCMSVDANVLIFERIREELRTGKTPIAAIDSGRNRLPGIQPRN